MAALKASRCWRAFAKFVRRRGRIFRLQTELRRPEGRGRVLGAVVMLNPGSSRPLGAGGEMAPATLDDTMLAVASIVGDAYQLAGQPLPLAGHLVIHNLFNLCEAHSLVAIANLEEYSQSEIEDSFWQDFSTWSGILTTAPWVWRAWGAEKEALRPFMVDWEERLGRLPRVGIRIRSYESGYYHPAYLKRMRKRHPELREEIVLQIAAMLPQSSARRVRPSGPKGAPHARD